MFIAAVLETTRDPRCRGHVATWNQCAEWGPRPLAESPLSAAGLLGAGPWLALPSRLSLPSHAGLVLGKLPEVTGNVLEPLCQPLEDRTVTIARAHMTLTFRADFMLVAAMNPCPCRH